MDLSALTFQQLRYLIAIEAHRSFREAALHCHVSQPALSTQLKKVEDLLGLCLFDRSRQPIVPTERGAAVVAQARVVLEQVDRIADIAGRRGELSGRYRLGIIPTLVPTLVPLVVAQFARAHPRVELDIDELKTDALVRRVREGTLDAGLAATPLEVPGVHERAVCWERFYVYLAPGHRLAARARIRQEDLTGEGPWLLSEGHCFRTQVLSLCEGDRAPAGDHGSCHVRYDGSSLEALIGLVDAGIGVTVLPELLVHGLPAVRVEAQVRPFAPPVPAREISLVYGREHVRRGIHDALHAAIRDALPAQLRERPASSTRILPPVSSKAPAARRQPAARRAPMTP